MCVHGWGGATSQEVIAVELLFLSHMRCRSLPAAVLCGSSISLLSQSIVLHNTMYDYFFCLCRDANDLL